MKLLKRDGTKRVSYTNIPVFNNSPLQLDENGTLYGITKDGKLWRGTLDGNTTELPLPNLISESKFLVNKNIFIYNNKQSVFIVNEEFDLLHTFELEHNIKDITTYNDNLIIKTNTTIYVWKEGEIRKGTPIETDGFTVGNDLDKDGKLNLIISRNSFLYNFEVE